MAEHAALKKALRQMAEGSKSAFHTFYMGSSQYIYSSALLLYDSHEDACRFMVDFYQYLYLHLPEYDRSQNLENWISRLMLERYEQLSIGKNMPKPSVKQQMNSGTTQLTKSEQERVWRMLDVNIHFPKEPARHFPGRYALLVSALLLLLLIASRFVPDMIRRLQSLATTQTENTDTEGGDTETDNATEEADDAADELDSIQDKLDDLLSERANADTDSSSDDETSFQQQQSATGDTDVQTKTPASPDEPDTPQEPEQPQTPEEPVMSEGSDTLSGTDDLEDLELELRYGDTLRF